MLTLLCLAGCGPYFSYDVPSILETQIMRKTQVTQTQYSTLSMAQGLPNIIMPLLCGIAASKFGESAVAIFTGLFVVAGLWCEAHGGYKDSFN